MKTFALLSVGFFVTASAVAQPHISNDTLYSSTGYPMFKNMEVTFGTGSTDDGDFRFIRRNADEFGTAMASTKSNQWNKQPISLPRSMAGHKGKIVKIIERGRKKTGYIYEVLVKAVMGDRYEIDVDNAITRGEIVVPDNFLPEQKVQAVAIRQAAPVSTHDEPGKL